MSDFILPGGLEQAFDVLKDSALSLQEERSVLKAELDECKQLRNVTYRRLLELLRCLESCGSLAEVRQRTKHFVDHKLPGLTP